MLYLVITVAAGLAMSALAVTSLIHQLKAGGVFVNQLRFLISGLLLIAHYPLARMLESLALRWLDSVSAIEGNAEAAFWGSLFALVTVQLVILPTRRELYTVHMMHLLHRNA